MSHFTLLVIGEDIEEQLAPFSENLDVEPYIDGTAEDARHTLEQGLDYFQHTQPPQYLGKTIDTLTLDEKLAILDEWSGGEYRQDDGGNLIRYSTYNPDSKWDWWEIGGRWSGFFYVKPGTPAEAFEPSKVHWSEQYQGSESVEKDVVGTTKAPNLTDSALKKHIDFELMRKDAEIKALQQWEKFEEATKGTVSPGSWASYASKIVGPSWNYDNWAAMTEQERKDYQAKVDVAREQFGKEPFVAASRTLGYFSDVHTVFMLDSPDPKKAFVERAVNTSTTAFAVLKDGEWFGKGEMGWFGMSTDTFDEDEWDAKVNELIDSLPDDTRLTICDLHI